ncbi:MAG TPA: tRNA (adenosine(37)-N6)-threonylcarbamoyltransferase complex ATPase subunit type 1 TsaE, partial [Vicinamibacteria bacterium]|nr:tRNA (adenosine(37)-N6)-threonylcarbamoyltransferase complex ATPase subunit type 1 TsaE [Vicinamibacteria bacterium]
MLNGVHESRSEAETEAIAAEFARDLAGGEVIFLEGDLGAGKTAFVRGLARGLGA